MAVSTSSDHTPRPSPTAPGREPTPRATAVGRADEEVSPRGSTLLEPGTRIGRWVLGRRIGAGGMGLVFEATEVDAPERKVALKVMRQLVVSTSSVARFQREIGIVRRLSHEAIVPVLDHGMHEGLPYYVMLWVGGVPLAELLAHLRERGSPPDDTGPVAEFLAAQVEGDGGAMRPAPYGRWVAHLGRRLAAALQHAHDRGVVHRDVKPGNIMVTTRGRPMLLDFGLAFEEADETLTASGDILGTLAYSAPEQLNGRTSDGRADVYSLGATLFELLTLRRPHDATDRKTLLDDIRIRPVVSLGRPVPRPLQTICKVALAARPRHRYRTARALADDLAAYLDGRSLRARPPGLLVRLPAAARRQRAVTIVAGVLLVVLTAILGRDAQQAGRRIDEARALMEQVATLEAGIDELRVLHEALLDPTGMRVRRGVDVPRVDQIRAQLSEQRRALDELLTSARDLLLVADNLQRGFGTARDLLADVAAARVRRGLADLDDVLAPHRMQEWIARLVEHDDEQRRAALVDDLGDLRITSEPSGVRLTLTRQGSAQVLLDDVTPVRAELPAGSYLVRLQAPGWEPTTVPLLVRSRAAPLPPGVDFPPWSDVAVTLLPAGTLSDRWVHVPAGWSLVGAEPPLWRWVDSFLVMRREVTYDDWLAYLNDPLAWVDEPGEESYQHVPRWSDDAARLHLERTPEGHWRPGPDVADPRWPVRGISRDDMGGYAAYVQGHHDDVVPGYYVDLPHELEWERAARGADGRPYPWGWDFDWTYCVSFYGRPDPEAEVWPRAVESVPTDVSVFDVRDMAGSLSEMTRDAHGTGRDLFAVRGGSYDRRERAELLAASRRPQGNTPRHDVGLRLVQRPWPDWLAQPAGCLGDFVDDFERHDADAVGEGWIELAAEPLQPPADPSESERCRVEQGRLVVEGGRGNFSNRGLALRSVGLDDASGCRVTALVSLSASGTGSPDDRGVRLALRDDQGRPLASLRLGRRGRLQLCGGRQPVDGWPTLDVSDGAPFGRPLHLELTWRPGHVVGRLWSPDEDRPQAAQLEHSLTTSRPPRLVGVEVGNTHGLRADVDHFACELLP